MGINRSISLVSISLIFVIVMIASFSTNDIFAQLEEPITVSTANFVYTDGQIIIITGQVRDRIENVPVSLTIIAPNGDIVAIARLDIDSYNNFRTEITAGGTMKDDGTYTIRVLYGSQARTAETTFYFISSGQPIITLTTDKTSYKSGDIIYVTGKTRIINSDITIGVNAPNQDIIAIARVSVDYNGNFATQISTGGSLWELTGNYLITAGYGTQKFAVSIFSFQSSGQQPSDCGPNQVFQLGECQDIDDAPKLLSSNPRLVDAFGNAIHSVSVGQQVQITVDLENQNNFSQDFVYYIAVRETVFEAWITGSMAPGQGFSPALAWTPKIAGTHTIDITVFDYIDTQNVLAPTLTIRLVVVEPSGSTLYVETDKSSYNEGDTIRISGEIQNPIDGTILVTLVIVDPTGELVGVHQVSPDSSGQFSISINTGSFWKASGEYQINAQYGAQKASNTFSFTASGFMPIPTPFDTTPPLILTPSDMTIDASDSSGARVYYSVKAIDDNDGILRPNCSPSSGSLFPIGETTVTCSGTDNSGNSARKSFLITVNPPDVLIPSWIKDVAGFWCGDEIDDTSFIEAIQYLINNDVIIVPTTISSGSGSQEIPNWVKSNACWWSQGLISNSDFASGLQYLIGQGIIRV